MLFKGVRQLLYKFLAFRGWRLLSQLALPMYLFHFPFIGLSYAILFGTTDPKQIENITFNHVLASFILSLILTILFSLLPHRYIEKPFLKKRSPRV